MSQKIYNFSEPETGYFRRRPRLFLFALQGAVVRAGFFGADIPLLHSFVKDSGKLVELAVVRGEKFLEIGADRLGTSRIVKAVKAAEK